MKQQGQQRGLSVSDPATGPGERSIVRRRAARSAVVASFIAITPIGFAACGAGTAAPATTLMSTTSVPINFPVSTTDAVGGGDSTATTSAPSIGVDGGIDQTTVDQMNQIDAELSQLDNQLNDLGGSLSGK